MTMQKTPIALAAVMLFSAAPLAAQTLPAPSTGTLEIWWKGPSANGATVSGTLQGSQCYVAGRGVSRVEFFLGGTRLNTDTTMSDGMSCVLNTTQFANGNHTLYAVAYDSAGRSYKEPRTINIQNTVTSNAGPSVTITSPASGATVSGSSVSCAATASDSDGVRDVRFMLDGTVISTDTSSPYNCTFDSTRLTNGTHTLRVDATDSRGAFTTRQVSFNVSNQVSSGGGSGTLPTLQFTAPANGILSGNVQGPPNCTVTGTNINRVAFYLNDVLTNTDGNGSNGWGCWIYTPAYANGNYTLRAVAYNAAGQTTTISRQVTIQNGTTGTTNTPPSVTISQPAANAVLAGSVGTANCAATASDSNGTVSNVRFSLTNAGGTEVWNQTDSTSAYQCTFDSRTLPNGTYTFMARATDNGGATATAQRTVSINNTVVSDPGGGTGSIASADIVFRASPDVPFSQHSSYNLQVLGTNNQSSSIPESGIHGATLPNGETLRYGKVSDPSNSIARALNFQVRNSDPVTSGSKRAEMRLPSNLVWNRTYWAAMSVYVYDWGTLASNDQALFGIQLHSGNDSLGLSPSFGLYTVGSSNRRFNVQARWSDSCGGGTCSGSTTMRYGEQDIPFGRWVDFVFKFRQNITGSGFLQVWMDGNLIANHQGRLGYDVGQNDYMKFGYYNWSSGMNSTARKVLMRSPTIVADPTGNTYSHEQLRSFIGGGTSAAGTGGTSSSSGSVCSSATCVVTQ